MINKSVCIKNYKKYSDLEITFFGNTFFTFQNTPMSQISCTIVRHCGIGTPTQYNIENNPVNVRHKRRMSENLWHKENEWLLYKARIFFFFQRYVGQGVICGSDWEKI